MTRISKLEARGLIGNTEVYQVAMEGGEIVALNSYEGWQGNASTATRVIWLHDRVAVRTVAVHYGAKLVVKEDYQKVRDEARRQVAKAVVAEAWYASNCGIIEGLREKLLDLTATGQAVEELDFSTVADERNTVAKMLATIQRARG